MEIPNFLVSHDLHTCTSLKISFKVEGYFMFDQFLKLMKQSNGNGFFEIDETK